MCSDSIQDRWSSSLDTAVVEGEVQFRKDGKVPLRTWFRVPVTPHLTTGGTTHVGMEEEDGDDWTIKKSLCQERL